MVGVCCLGAIDFREKHAALRVRPLGSHSELTSNSSGLDSHVQPLVGLKLVKKGQRPWGTLMGSPGKLPQLSKTINKIDMDFLLS